MAVSPSSSVQRARQQLAERLREIRLDAGLTARALSAAAGWHEAKTSRIESAKQALTDTDIQVWCLVCGAQREAPDLIAASRAADSMYVEWRRLTRTGLRHTQDARRPLYERTRLFKVYCSTVVPGFLQTPAYASALLQANSGFHATPDDVEDAVRARMSRNRIMQSPGHQFAMLIEEAVLRYRLGGAETMAGQLGHLLERGHASRGEARGDPVLRGRAANVDVGDLHRLRRLPGARRIAVSPGNGHCPERDHPVRPCLRKACPAWPSTGRRRGP